MELIKIIWRDWTFQTIAESSRCDFELPATDSTCTLQNNNLKIPREVF